MSSSDEIVLGIDLGTTYSCAAYVGDGIPRVIPSEKGYTTMPSVVGLSPKGEIVVGHPAMDQMVTKPSETIYGSKRLVGRKFNSYIVQEMRQFMSYPIVEGSNGEAAVKIGEKQYDLSEISSFILSEIVAVAQGQLETKISRAVITVPAYYNDNQRQAVKRAGVMAGLQVDRIVNEPTAAAIAYGFNRKFKQTILIYDFGGGTFDVSVLQVNNNKFKVLATGGDTFLGGVDVDNRLTAYALEQFRKATGKDLVSEKVAMQRLRQAAEQCKRDLSDRTSVEMLLPFITKINDEAVDLRIKLTRDQLNRLSAHFVDRTLQMCDDVLDSVGMKSSQIDAVLLVGGQTRMPLIRERIAKHFGKEPRKGVHPEEVVALGAAILANMGAKGSSVQLRDVLSIPIGVALPGGGFKVIMDRNTPIPTSKSFRVTVKKDDMLVIDLYQGEHKRVLQNEYLGTFSFPAPEKGRRGGRDLEMRFELSPECLLAVHVRDLETGETTSTAMVTVQSPKSLKEALAAEAKEGTTPKSGWFQSFARGILGKD